MADTNDTQQSIASMMNGDQFDDIDMDDLDDIVTNNVTQTTSFMDKIKDTLLQDTSHKQLSQYQPNEYSFLPNNQGSRRILRAVDVAIGALNTVLSDLVLGLFELSKDKGDNTK